jgi:molybdate transport system substrate-binding protein
MLSASRIAAQVLAIVVAASGARCAAGPPAVRVAAAADLQFALEEIARRFTADGGARVDPVFGSSGVLTRQIREGAPFDLFLSADEAFVDELHRDGMTRDAGALYAIGRIVLFAPTGSPLDPADGLQGLGRLVERGGPRRFAIANPEHAPYGRAAEEALRSQGLWERLRPLLVYGENVAQAAHFATTGTATGGIIAYSLALAPAMRDRGTFVLIPEADHAPLRQRMVLLPRAGNEAERFYQYLQQPAAREILVRYGFSLPEQVPGNTQSGRKAQGLQSGKSTNSKSQTSASRINGTR